VLRPGGRIFVVAPFLFPFHGYPEDYWRFSLRGLRALFAGFDETDSGVYHGPGSMVLNILTDVAAGLLFPSKGKLYLATKGLLLIPVFWLKFVDILLARLPGATHYASTLFFIGAKR